MLRVGETERTRVDLDEKTGCLEFLSKDTGHVWKRIPVGGYILKEASTARSSLEVYAEFIRTDEGGIEVPFRLPYLLGELPADLHIEVETDPERKIGEVYYPYPFILDEIGSYLVISLNNGILYSIRDLTFPNRAVS